MNRKGLAALTLAAIYWFPVRRWMGQWGSTADERACVMPGDRVIPHPTHVETQAVTVDAPPADIWPWLVQIGSRRGGLYSYDWLDRLFGFLDRPSASHVLPEYQHLAVGDRIEWGREYLTVAALEPNRALVLSYNGHGMEWVWQFGLYPLDGQHTRLVSRGSERTPKTATFWLFMRVMEPASFVMTSKMLLNLKNRAEWFHASDVARLPGQSRSLSGSRAG
jgi:hypothetical protein